MRDISVAVENFLNNVGLNIVSPVCHRRNRRNHLHGRDSEGLTEGFRCKLNRSHIVGGIINAGSFSGKVDAGFLGKSKGPKVIIKKIWTKSLTDFDKGGVTGIFKNVDKALRPVTAKLMAVIPRSGNNNVTRAVECRTCGNLFFFKSGRTGYNLENRSRLICIGNGLVFPLLR